MIRHQTLHGQLGAVLDFIEIPHKWTIGHVFMSSMYTNQSAERLKPPDERYAPYALTSSLVETDLHKT